MNYRECGNYEEMSRAGAEIIAGMVKEKPDCVLGLATGSTPLGIYRELVQRYRSGQLDFSGVRTVNLDEYAGLAAKDPQSYHFYMRENFLKDVNIKEGNAYLPDGLAPDAKEECRRYDALLASLGGTDLQLLGIGNNGHIGFNEPADCFIAETHAVELDDRTRKANARFFASEDQVPEKALTMGMKAILGAKKILLVANGKEKGEIIRKAFEGCVTPLIPASILQLHPDCTVLFTEDPG